MEPISFPIAQDIEFTTREEEILDLVQDTDFLILARYMQVNQMISSVPNHINYLVNIGKNLGYYILS